MKYFHSFHVALALALAGLLNLACSGYDSPLKGVIISDVTLGAKQSFQDIGFGSDDMSNCVIQSSEEWCLAYVLESKLRVVVLDNNSYSERTADIHVSDTEDGTTLDFKVIQLQNDAILTPQNYYEVPEEGAVIRIDFQTNVDYEEILPEVDWIKPATRATRALRDEFLELSVLSNEYGEERTAIVKLVDKTKNITRDITIHQLAYPYIQLDRDYVLVDEAGGDVEIIVSTNFQYRTEPENRQNWLSTGERTLLSPFRYSQQLHVSALPESVDSRNCIVYFVNSDLTVSKLLRVEQTRSNDM